MAAVLSCFLISAAARAGADHTILVFGDSLSAAYGFDVEKSWVNLLEHRLRQKGINYKVANASISGETTRGGRARIRAVLNATDPDIVIVELGGNDGLRGINLESTQANLEMIVDDSLAAGAQVLLLAMDLPPNYGASYIGRFRRIYTQSAGRNGVRLVPFFLQGVAGDPALMQADGIHPQAKAQPMLLDNIWPYLEPLLVR